MITKNQMIYVGVGALVFLILVSSTKKVVLQEVAPDVTPTKSFDSSSLPPSLKPPYRLAEGEPLPTLAKRSYSFNSLGFKPRFDT